jgi:hypothetical protein
VKFVLIHSMTLLTQAEKGVIHPFGYSTAQGAASRKM